MAALAGLLLVTASLVVVRPSPAGALDPPISTTIGGTGFATIDPTTGASQVIVADAGQAGTYAAAVDTDGTLYALYDWPGVSVLASIDGTTGALTTIGSTGVALLGFEIGPDGTFYGTGFGAGTDLYRIDKVTGAATLVGPTGVSSIMDLDFDCSGQLRATTNGSLWTVDPDTGSTGPPLDITGVTLGGGAASIMGLMTGADGTTYATTHTSPGYLYRVDLDTGVAVLVGDTTLSIPHGGDILSSCPVPPVFTAASPPPTATVGVASTYTYVASGHPAPSFSVASGALPTGLSLDAATGALSGTPSAAGSYTFTIRAANGVTPDATGPSTTITVSPAPAAPVFTAASPPPTATVGVASTYTYVASGHPAPSFSVASGALPTGLSLDAATGALSGTPSAAGSYTFTIRAANGVTPDATGPSTTITVSPAPVALRGGGGHWLVAADGGTFAFGDAVFHGSMGGIAVNRPIVGMAPTPSGRGYWLVAADGGTFAFGDAVFHGSMGGIALDRPIVGMAPTASGRGYWLVAADGGTFAFGDAVFHGSMGGIAVDRPIVGMAPTASGQGYWLVAADGGTFAFGDAAFHGSMGDAALNLPAVGMTSTLVVTAPR